MSDQDVIHSSENPNWRTPDACFHALDDEFHFAVDAAATRVDSKCGVYFGPDQTDPRLRDALSVDWADYGDHREPIFLNPPYSRKVYRATHNPALLIANWARKCWEESQKGCTIVGVFPFSPQTDWYTSYVQGISADGGWNGHAAMEERRLPHRISFLRENGTVAANAGVNSVIVVWKRNPGFIGAWQPAVRYWTYRTVQQTLPLTAALLEDLGQLARVAINGATQHS